MHKTVQRGYVLQDTIEFSAEKLELLRKAAVEICFLLDRGYDIKSAATFVGNHYMLSNRQRLALARSLSPKADLEVREKTALAPDDLEGSVVHIDGFNTIITLEVAFSGSLLIKGQDKTVRDLAGLRGSYQIIDKTGRAIRSIYGALEQKRVRKAEFYLDSPVSNSGRLASMIMELSADYHIEAETFVIPDVDRVLSQKDHVITTDAIILNHCGSWINLNSWILEEELQTEVGERSPYWMIAVGSPGRS